MYFDRRLNMLTMKDVVRDGHPILRTKVDEVTTIDEQTQNELREMRQFLINSQDEEIAEKYDLRAGVGLAAPQININKRMLAVYLTDDNDEPVYDLMLINPKIISHSVQESFLPTGEGCLSVDEDIDGLVHRKKRIKVRALDIDGNEVVIKASGMLSIVLQHELDHLDGILFYDHINKETPLLPKDGATPLE